jgi:hypothetical protein
MNKIQRPVIKRKHFAGGFFVAGSLSLFYAGAMAMFTPLNYEASPSNGTLLSQEKPLVENAKAPKNEDIPPVLHIKTPEVVKGIYMSSWVAGTPSVREKVINIVNHTEANSLMVDIKDYSGRVSYEVSNPELQKIGSVEKRIPDMQGLLARLHQDNIYTIGRIAVFQDPYFVKIHPELAVKSKKNGGPWKDRKGITWLDPNSREVWDYIIALAKDAHEAGFDEINFDYIRFPSDGDIQDMFFPLSGTKPKPEVIKEFFAYLDEHMKTAGITTSADIFGMTTTSTDDLNIGQVLENALPYFDYICPMVYPSHYPPGFHGWKNPNAYPYELIHYVMKSGVDRAIAANTTPLKLRPWLQDFSMGTPSYGKKEVEEQIQGVYDSGLTSWMLWDPSNKYKGGGAFERIIYFFVKVAPSFSFV